jgi:hypothetical protein
VAEERVTVDEQAVYEFMRDIDGPVGDLMREIARQLEAVAVEHAPILKAKNVWSLRSTAFRTADGTIKTPGYLKRNITSKVGLAVTMDNMMFAGADAPGDPGIFLEAPAEQMHEKHPFLSTALWAVEVD